MQGSSFHIGRRYMRRYDYDRRKMDLSCTTPLELFYHIAGWTRLSLLASKSPPIFDPDFQPKAENCTRGQLPGFRNNNFLSLWMTGCKSTSKLSLSHSWCTASVCTEFDLSRFLHPKKYLNVFTKYIPFVYSVSNPGCSRIPFFN